MAFTKGNSVLSCRKYGNLLFESLYIHTKDNSESEGRSPYPQTCEYIYIYINHTKCGNNGSSILSNVHNTQKNATHMVPPIQYQSCHLS